MIRMWLLLALVGTGHLEAQEKFFPERPTGWVTDQAGVLDPKSEAVLAMQLQKLKDETKLVLGIAILPTIGDYQPYEVATAIGRKWGVANTGPLGQGTKDLGATMLIVPKGAQSERGRCFVATAKGAEGFLTDNRMSEVCGQMIPFFKANNYFAGLTVGVQRIETYARDERQTVAAAPYAAKGAFNIWIILLAVFALAVVVFVIIRSYLREQQRLDSSRRTAMQNMRRYRDPTETISPRPRVVPVVAPPPVARRSEPEPPRRTDDDSPSGGGGFSFGGGSDSYSGGGAGRDW